MSEYDEEEFDEVGDAPSPATIAEIENFGSLAIELTPYLFAKIVDTATYAVVERVLRNHEAKIKAAVEAAITRAVDENLSAAIALSLSALDGEKPLADRVAEEVSAWGSQMVNHEGKVSADPYNRSRYDQTRLQWFVKKEVGEHLTKEAGASLEGLKHNARKIATDLLAAAIHERLPKMIT